MHLCSGKPTKVCLPAAQVRSSLPDTACCCRREGETAHLEVRLPEGQTADYLNFVVKDSSSNRWFDSHGSNFHVPLRLALSSMAEITIDEEVGAVRAQLSVSCRNVWPCSRSGACISHERLISCKTGP